MSQIEYFTQKGYDELKAEIHHLKSKERPSISRQIQEAREKGDLSENAEYDAAKEAQGLLELKIAKLENLFANARVVDESDMDLSTVQPLCKVKIRNLKNKAEMTYMLVSEKEADLKSKKISVGSPIGKGLLNKSIGDKVKIQVPNGTVEFEVLEISI